MALPYNEAWSDNIDMTDDRWYLHVLRQSPTLNFTDKFIDIISKIPLLSEDNFRTIDGKSREEWCRNPPPSFLLNDDDRNIYEGRRGFQFGMRRMREVPLEERRDHPKQEVIERYENWMVDMFEDDEQSIRCAYEFWRAETISPTVITASHAWKAGIDLDNPNWPYDALRKCPDVNFSNEFLEKLTRTRVWSDGYEIPDGRRLIDWYHAPLPAPAAIPYYDPEPHYLKLFDFINYPHSRLAEEWYGFGNPIDEFIYDMKDLRARLTDEVLVRCVEEHWRTETHHLAIRLVFERNDTAALKAELEDIRGALEAEQNDTMRDFTWSEENQREEIEENQRWQEKMHTSHKKM